MEPALDPPLTLLSPTLLVEEWEENVQNVLVKLELKSRLDA